MRWGLRDNHVHMMVAVRPTIAVASLVEKLKGKSSYMIRREFWDGLAQAKWSMQFLSCLCGSEGHWTFARELPHQFSVKQVPRLSEEHPSEFVFCDMNRGAWGYEKTTPKTPVSYVPINSGEIEAPLASARGASISRFLCKSPMSVMVISTV
ncbi:transposase [Candidatus Enterovibrio escicola]|uniref:transposase n=1 Tax=Candidatus Enterovibrio escicola TaxID=1927127 RepID=UPI0012382C81|nr:transposase [Candidatus Enterovibrio escacola]